MPENNTQKIATTVAIVVTALIYLAAFLVHWRTHVLFVMDRIVGTLELVGGLIGLVFGFAIVSVVIRMLIIGLVDLWSWIFHQRQRGRPAIPTDDGDQRA